MNVDVDCLRRARGFPIVGLFRWAGAFCLAALLASMGCFLGCYDQNSRSAVPITVSISPGWPHTLMEGQSLDINASVSNDSSNSGVRWSLSGNGRLSNETTTSVTYNAPSRVRGDQYPTVTAISRTSPRSTATLQITVVARGSL